ncbi:NAD-dependent epimerase/dehydratase family protein [Radiobacillus sp. PE A8.2]|uniref:NAD-dependent epimerase/dehydratase family protein n=1 Tax=Radiobacillus sp. PE A8.2 TaxID=3380349 RepID=UPI00388F9226
MKHALPKILITGASGFTGQHACTHFLQAGFEVIAVARSHFHADQIQIESCDLTEKEAVRKLIHKTKPHYVLHLAGQNHVGQSWDDPISTMESNALSTLFLLEAVRREAPSAKVVVVGSALEFDTTNIATLTHPYSLSKTIQSIIAQAWQRLYDMDIVIAKPTNLIGPGVSTGVCSVFAKKIAGMELGVAPTVLKVNNLQAQRDFLDVRDAIRAYESLLRMGRAGEIYPVYSGENRSLEEIIFAFKKLTSIEFKVQAKVVNQQEHPEEVISEALMQLGWRPLIPLEVTLQEILEYCRNSN